MADTTKKRKKGSISEENVSTLLQRYVFAILILIMIEKIHSFNFFLLVSLKVLCADGAGVTARGGGGCREEN